MRCQAKLIISLLVIVTAVLADPHQKWGNHGPCSATPLRVSSTAETHYASNHGTPPPSDSCTSDSQSGAWWGSFLVPSGTVVNFSTCEASTANFDTVVSIYSGSSCIKLSCEATFTNGSTCTHFTWTSTGSQLFVAVQGVGTQSGDFGLTTQIVSQTEATCAAPIKLQIQPVGVQQFSGSLEYGSVTAPPACEYYYYWDDADAAFAGTTVVWYEITTLEHALVHFEASSNCAGPGTVVLQVSSGDCSDLTCMQSGKCNLDLDLAANSVYYLTVAGDSRFKSSYQVDFRVYPRAPLTCFNAEHVYAGYYFTYFYYVDTTSGSFLQDDPCGATGQAFWGQVYVPAVGTNVTLSTCGYWTNFDTVISVYSGSCGELSCVAINDNSPNYCQYDYINSGSSQVSFLATDTTYYFTVTGAQGQTGQAEVLVTAHEGAF